MNAGVRHQPQELSFFKLTLAGQSDSLKPFQQNPVVSFVSGKSKLGLNTSYRI